MICKNIAKYLIIHRIVILLGKKQKKKRKKKGKYTDSVLMKAGMN